MKVDENSTVFDIAAVSFDKIFVSVFYWIISLCGLFLHILVLITTLKKSKSNNTSQNFHFFLHSLCIADCMVYLLYILYAAPCVLMSRQVYGSTVGYYMGLFENIDFIAIVLLTFIISINRAVSIKPSSVLSKVFQKKLCYFMVILSWLIGIGIIVVDTNYTTCRIVFEEAKFYFSYFCSDPNQSPTNSVSMIVIYVGVFSVALVYCISILQIWKQRNSIDDSNHQQRSNLNKYRNRLFYQALIIWLSLAINVLSKL